jgi:hypothetical protein
MKTISRISKQLGSVALLLLPLITTAAQEPAKTLEWSVNPRTCGSTGAPESKTCEIELEDILIDGRSILIGEPFVGDIRDLVFRVKNISDRPIAFVQITVVLPDVKHPPEIPFVRTSPESKTKAVQPGEETELRVPSGKLYDWVKDTVAAQGMELQSIKRAAIYSIIVVKNGQPLGECLKTRDPRNECSPRPSGR